MRVSKKRKSGLLKSLVFLKSLFKNLLENFEIKKLNIYSLVIIKSNAKAVNSSPKNIKGSTALMMVSGRLNTK